MSLFPSIEKPASCSRLKYLGQKGLLCANANTSQSKRPRNVFQYAHSQCREPSWTQVWANSRVVDIFQGPDIFGLDGAPILSGERWSPTRRSWNSYQASAFITRSFSGSPPRPSRTVRWAITRVVGFQSTVVVQNWIYRLGAGLPSLETIKWHLKSSSKIHHEGYRRPWQRDFDERKPPSVIGFLYSIADFPLSWYSILTNDLSPNDLGAWICMGIYIDTNCQCKGNVCLMTVEAKQHSGWFCRFREQRSRQEEITDFSVKRRNKSPKLLGTRKVSE